MGRPYHTPYQSLREPDISRSNVAQLDFNKTLIIGETKFDNAITGGDIGKAEIIASQYMNVLGQHGEVSVNKVALARLALKEIAIPLYARAVYDTDLSQNAALDAEISGVYTNVVRLLLFFKDMRESLRIDGMRRDDPIIKEIQGALSELMVFALTTRGQGRPDDQFIILPSTRRQDLTGRVAGKREKQSFDFIVKERKTKKAIKLQVKTARHQHANETYDRSIAVVSTEALAGDRGAMYRLMSSLSSELKGTSRPQQAEQVDTAVTELTDIYTKHFKRFGKKAITATNI
jgi:hypothetical protein